MSPLLLLVFLVPLAAATVRPSPPALAFPATTPDRPGTLRTTAADPDGSLYAAGHTPLTAFVAKYTSAQRNVWRTLLPSLRDTPPALAYSRVQGLFVIAASNATTTSTSGEGQQPDEAFADLTLYELDPSNGTVLRVALVDRVRLPPHPFLRCVLADAAPADEVVVYLTYLVQDGQSPSVARTKLVRMSPAPATHQFVPVWKTVVTPENRAATSAAVARDRSTGSSIVVEVSNPRDATENQPSNLLTLHHVDDKGAVTSSAHLNGTQHDSRVAQVAVDDKGIVYLAEAPSLLHCVTLQQIDGQNVLTKRWSVNKTDVADMTALRNGTALYVLSNGPGFRIEDQQLVRATSPVLSVYNETGNVLFTRVYVEALPDVERQMYSLSLVDPPVSSDAFLGGFMRTTTGNGGEKMVSIGVYPFPNLFNVKNTEDGNESSPAPTDPNRAGVISQPPNPVIIVVGVCAALIVVLLIVGTALFIVYRNKETAAEEEKQRTRKQLEVKNSIQETRETSYSVLV